MRRAFVWLWLFSGALCAGVSKTDDAFLEDISQRCFRFFWEQADPHTGIVRDRAQTNGDPHPGTARDIGSIAATGFGLTALCIGAQRHWITQQGAHDRAMATLHFFADRAPAEHGWFYHWMDLASGERRWNSEASTIDTALLLGGVLTVRQYFATDREIPALAQRIYERIDFPWMLNGDPLLLSHGWRPENGFIKNRWSNYSEEAMLYLLGIGSQTHALRPESWYAFRRDTTTYDVYTYIAGARPLFIHQYSHAWFDFRGVRDQQQVDWFQNSATATRAHRAFCIDLARDFRDYSATMWGITASDSQKGYVAWGGPPRDPHIDGTLVPCAPGGSLMFAPDICLPALHAMFDQFGKRIYGRYGFVDAFNPLSGWTDSDVIGIDLGITLLSAENLRTGNVWRWFMANPEARAALDRAHFSAAKLRRKAAAAR